VFEVNYGSKFDTLSQNDKRWATYLKISSKCNYLGSAETIWAGIDPQVVNIYWIYRLVSGPVLGRQLLAVSCLKT